MKVAVVTAPGTVELHEEPTPEFAPDELLVEVGACGLCTMERRLFSGEKRVYPVAPGHEVAGEVVAVGSLVEGRPGAPQTGERVTVDLLRVAVVPVVPPRPLRCAACRRAARSAMARSRWGRVWPTT